MENDNIAINNNTDDIVRARITATNDATETQRRVIGTNPLMVVNSRYISGYLR